MSRARSLAESYEVIFRELPSSQTAAMLAAIEDHLGIAQDDPMAQSLVLLLRVADQFDAIARQLRDNDRQHLSELEEVAKNLRTLNTDLQATMDRTSRQRHRIPEPWDAPNPRVPVDTRHMAFPVLSYFADAFRWRRGAIDEDDRTTHARIDLAMVVALGIVLLGIGVAIGPAFHR